MEKLMADQGGRLTLEKGDDPEELRRALKAAAAAVNQRVQGDGLAGGWVHASVRGVTVARPTRAPLSSLIARCRCATAPADVDRGHAPPHGAILIIGLTVRT
jgi:hypothetical protein